MNKSEESQQTTNERKVNLRRLYHRFIGFNFRDFYRIYIAGLKDKERRKKAKVRLTIDQYKFILASFFGYIYAAMYNDDYVYTLPFSMGYIKIEKIETGAEFNRFGGFIKKSVTYPIDREKTKEAIEKNKDLGKRVYNMDMKYRYRVVWSRRPVKNISYYYFVPDKEIMSFLFKQLKEEEK